MVIFPMDKVKHGQFTMLPPVPAVRAAGRWSGPCAPSESGKIIPLGPPVRQCLALPEGGDGEGDAA